MAFMNRNRYLCLMLGMAVSLGSPAVCFSEENDETYRAPKGYQNTDSNDVDRPQAAPSKYKERITIQRQPGSRYEKITVTPPVQNLPKPAVMPETRQTDERWKKYDDMTTSPSEVGSPSDSFILAPN